MSNKIRPSRSEVTGAVPANGDASVSGELHINIIDRKVYQKDATGAVQLVADRIDDYSDQKQYAVKDFCVYDDGQGDKLYRCNTAITTPEAWDELKWDLLGGGGGGDLTDAIIKAPDAAGRNTIDTSAGTDIEALVIQGPTTQATDLIRVEGTQAGDTGALTVDSLGFPGQRFGAAAHRATTSAHGFTAVGQAAALSGVNWIPAQHGTNDTIAIFQENIETNTFVLRQAGLITGLDTAAFAGGTITPGTYYYTSDTVAGQLTTFQAAGAPAVLFTTSATEGLVLTGNLGAPRAITTGDTFPSPAELGALHYMTAEPVGLYVYYDDGDSIQWVQTNGGAIAGDYVLKTGDTMTGPLTVEDGNQVVGMGASNAVPYAYLSMANATTGSSVQLDNFGDKARLLVDNNLAAEFDADGNYYPKGTGGSNMVIAPTAGLEYVQWNTGCFFQYDGANGRLNQWVSSAWIVSVDANGYTMRQSPNSQLSRSIYFDTTAGATYSYMYGFNTTAAGVGVVTGGQSFSMQNNGSAFAPVAWVDGSSGRFKEKVKPLKQSLKKVKKMKPVEYDRNDTETPMHMMGFIAEELRDVLPEAVVEMANPDPDGEPLLGVHSAQVVAVLVQAVQELTEEVERLKEKK